MEVIAGFFAMIGGVIGVIVITVIITTGEWVNEERLRAGKEFVVSEGHTYVCQPTEKTAKLLALENEIKKVKSK